MDEEILKHKRIATLISIVMLLLAIPPIWPYGYYTLLRIVVCGTCAFLTWIANELNKTFWIWIFGLLTLVFNPVMPIHLDKETWVAIDGIAAFFILLSLWKVK